ncbi:BnaC02g30170D [Brassica napus]|uniref:BnaC02g30170D protein n=1 Tax=Brassica napus TaxID=3708 RepID=A0A078GIM7_BRANA|nr:BnaC02g30170D [Brassica napus]
MISSHHNPDWIDTGDNSGRGAIRSQSDPSHGSEELSDRETGESILIFNLALSAAVGTEEAERLDMILITRLYTSQSSIQASSSKIIRAPGSAVSKTPSGDHSFFIFDKN